MNFQSNKERFKKHSSQLIYVSEETKSTQPPVPSPLHNSLLCCLPVLSSGMFLFRGVPEHIRSDNGPEFTMKAIRDLLYRFRVESLFIEPSSPRENG